MRGLLLILCLACAHTDPQELYRRGQLEYELAQYQQAIDDFTLAYQATGKPALLYDLAQAYRKSRSPQKALSLYRAYLRQVPRAHNRTEVERRIAEIAQAR
jgi:outer membrane protein assembly factor BamD (BamD/ComL family)